MPLNCTATTARRAERSTEAEAISRHKRIGFPEEYPDISQQKGIDSPEECPDMSRQKSIELIRFYSRLPASGRQAGLFFSIFH